MSANRQDWVDATKGAAIVLVVIGHAWRGVNGRGLIPPDLFAAVDGRIYAFHMPVFFALSGLFFAGSLARATPGTFLRSRLTRLFWPMVLWTYLFLAVKVLAGARANNPVALSEMAIWPVPGYLHLWFLWALLLIHLAFLATRPLLKDGHYPWGVLALIGAGCAAASLVLLPREVAYWIGNAVRFAPFFVLGLALGQSTLLERTPVWGRATAAAVFVVILVFWPSEGTALRLLGSLVLTLTFLMVFAGIGAIARGAALTWLVALGTASMAIYLAHTIFSATLRELLLALGQRDLTLHLMLGTVVGIVGPLVMLWLARRTGTRRLLGF